MSRAGVVSRMGEDSALSPRCPRCGYDLSGALAGAGLRRPDRSHPCTPGRCSECGLDFEWAEVLDPSRRDVPWLYDHAPRGRLRPRWVRAGRTLLRTVLPWRFWGTDQDRVQVRSRIGTARLLLWLPVMILPLHAVWSIALMTTRIRSLNEAFYGKFPALWGTEWGTLLVNSWVYPYGRFEGSPSAGMRFRTVQPNASALIPLGMSLAVPAVLLVLARTRAVSRVRTVHVVRAAVYGMSWAVWWYLVWAVVYTARTVRAFNPALDVPDIIGWARTMAFRLGINHDIWANPRVWGGTLWVAWLGAWWWFALRRGLQIRHAGWVWALAMIAALLTGALLALMDRSFTRALYG